MFDLVDRPTYDAAANGILGQEQMLSHSLRPAARQRPRPERDGCNGDVVWKRVTYAAGKIAITIDTLDDDFPANWQISVLFFLILALTTL